MTNPELEHKADEVKKANLCPNDSADVRSPRMKIAEAIRQGLIEDRDPLASGDWNPGSRDRNAFENGHRHVTKEDRRYGKMYRHKSEANSYKGRGK